MAEMVFNFIDVKRSFAWFSVALLLALSGCATTPELGKQNSYLFYKDVPYADYGDNIKLIADIYDPDTLNAPIVLLIHGGGWDSRSSDMQGIAQDLAKKGFLVYAATYRLVPRAIFPAQLDDMKNALKFIHADAPARSGDASQIFVWGYSSGGYLAFMLGLNPENKIKGIVTGAAPTDFTEFPKSPLITKFLGRSFAQDPKYWTLVSAVNNVSEKSPPVYMYHGDDDSLVDIDQMYFMKEELEKKKVPVTVREVKGLGHVSLAMLDQKSVNQGISFLLALAKNGAAGAAMGAGAGAPGAAVAPIGVGATGFSSVAPTDATGAPTEAATPGTSTGAPADGGTSASSVTTPNDGATPGSSTASVESDDSKVNSPTEVKTKPVAKPKRKKRR